MMNNKHYYICYRDYAWGGTAKFIHLYSEEEREAALESGRFNFMEEICDDGNRTYHYASLKI